MLGHPISQEQCWDYPMRKKKLEMFDAPPFQRPFSYRSRLVRIVDLSKPAPHLLFHLVSSPVRELKGLERFQDGRLGV